MRTVSMQSEDGRRAKLQARVWEAMTELFGALWTTHAGSIPSKAWRAGLATLTAEEIERGMTALLNDWSERYPPTWPQFRMLCRPQTAEQRARDARIALEQPARQALPSPEDVFKQEETGRAWLAAARDGATSEEMAQAISRERAEILRRYGVEEGQ